MTPTFRSDDYRTAAGAAFARRTIEAYDDARDGDWSEHLAHTVNGGPDTLAAQLAETSGTPAPSVDDCAADANALWSAAPMSRKELRSWHEERIQEAQWRHWSALTSVHRFTVDGEDDGTTMADVDEASAAINQARAAARADGFVVDIMSLHSPAHVFEPRIEE